MGVEYLYCAIAGAPLSGWAMIGAAIMTESKTRNISRTVCLFILGLLAVMN
jgi:hypothetical protein